MNGWRVICGKPSGVTVCSFRPWPVTGGNTGGKPTGVTNWPPGPGRVIGGNGLATWATGAIAGVAAAGVVITCRRVAGPGVIIPYCADKLVLLNILPVVAVRAVFGV